MKYLLLALLFIGAGCIGIGQKTMTNQEIVDEVRFCENEGMEARLSIGWNHGDVIKVTCLPLDL